MEEFYRYGSMPRTMRSAFPRRVVVFDRNGNVLDAYPGISTAKVQENGTLRVNVKDETTVENVWNTVVYAAGSWSKFNLIRLDV